MTNSTTDAAETEPETGFEDGEEYEDEGEGKDASVILSIALEHYEARVSQISGIGDRDTGHWLFAQAMGAIHTREDWTPETAINRTDAALKMLEGLQPRTAAEAMIAGQMMAAHECAMHCYKIGIHNTNPDHIKMLLGQANKLSRTYAMLHESMLKGRNKGKQTVNVNHHHYQYVNAPNAEQVNAAGYVDRGDRPERGKQPHAANGYADENSGARTLEHRPEMWGENPFRETVHGKSCARAETVSDAWWDKSRSTKG